MTVAVPYQIPADPYKCRLITIEELPVLERALLGEFAQAIWFLIDTGALPRPSDGNEFGTKLIELTEATLIGL